MMEVNIADLIWSPFIYPRGRLQIVGAISLIIQDIIYLTTCIKYLYAFNISLIIIRYKFSPAIKMERN